MNGWQFVDTALAPDFATINLAYISLLVSAFCASINRVRLLLVLAAAFFVAYAAIQGIGSMLIWNLVIGALNFHRLVAGLWADAQVSLTAEQESMWRRLFDDLTPRDFKRLWELGDDLQCADELLVEAGNAPDRLHLVLGGTVQIERGGAVLHALGPGAVIGQIEPLPFSTPSADWRAVGAVRLRSWTLADLSAADLGRSTLRRLTMGHHPAPGLVA